MDPHDAVQQSQSQAFAVGERIYISNGHENKDIAQDFSIDIDGWGTLTGSIQPHSYALLRISDAEIWVMANGDTKGAYTDSRTSTLRLELSAEPSVEIERGDISFEWLEDHILISMAHSSGAGTCVISR